MLLTQPGMIFTVAVTLRVSHPHPHPQQLNSLGITKFHEYSGIRGSKKLLLIELFSLAVSLALDVPLCPRLTARRQRA